jgi:hypothetical protein
VNDEEIYDGSQHDYGEWYEHDHSLLTAALVCLAALVGLAITLAGLVAGAVYVAHRFIGGRT